MNQCLTVVFMPTIAGGPASQAMPLISVQAIDAPGPLTARERST
jgi:hypothetical protein